MTPAFPTTLQHAARSLTVLLLPTLIAGCIGLRPTKIPLDAIVSESPATRGPKVLIVFLPGAQEVPADIVKQGFVSQVRDRNIAADVIVVDLHVGYFRNRTMLERLDRDVIEPARARGYAGVWFAGISLGGLGSLLYASDADGAERPAVAGVMAIAPFIADRETMREVTDAGGLARWVPVEPPARSDFSRRLLLWLQGYGDSAQKRPPLFLGYGSNDGYRETTAMLGNVVPRQRLFVSPGGHTWEPWRAIWGAMLDRAPLPRVVSPS